MTSITVIKRISFHDDNVILGFVRCLVIEKSKYSGTVNSLPPTFAENPPNSRMPYPKNSTLTACSTICTSIVGTARVRVWIRFFRSKPTSNETKMTPISITMALTIFTVVIRSCKNKTAKKKINRFVSRSIDCTTDTGPMLKFLLYNVNTINTPVPKIASGKSRTSGVNRKPINGTNRSVRGTLIPGSKSLSKMHHAWPPPCQDK